LADKKGQEKALPTDCGTTLGKISGEKRIGVDRTSCERRRYPGHMPALFLVFKTLKIPGNLQKESGHFYLSLEL
jgi:hypothetical protein